MPETVRLFAVVGNPVLHSRSPALFNDQFQRQEVDAIYTRLAASSGQDAFLLFQQLGLDGMNVTAPFKQIIIPHLDVIDPEARVIDSVNTVVRRGSQIWGYNTDHFGVVASFLAQGIDVKGSNCIVVGAGGAGRAAVYGLMRAGAQVVLINRNLEKGEAVADRLKCRAAPLDALESELASAEILVSTLPRQVDIIKSEWLRSDCIVADANYGSSTLIQMAIERGAKTIRGEDWLIFQALPAYQHFVGKDPELEHMKEVIQRPLWQKPRNVALIGFMGAGKSTVAQELARLSSFDMYDLDEGIESEEHQSIPQLFASRGEAAFRQIESHFLARLVNRERSIWACGGGIVLSESNRSLLKEHSLVVWLHVSAQSAVQRIPVGTRPLLSNTNALAKARSILEERRKLYGLTADLVINTETLSAHHVAGRIYEEIGKSIQDFWHG